jgi:hypothetical protein
MTKTITKAFHLPRGNLEITGAGGTFIAARVMPGWH